ncbi:hypothetical protein SOVF_111940 [Spinacia oleracea]|uniref:Uncharacterized protein n=1 Tax=Spinacia oleracea TaxID=3562 RepID=A0A9R0J1R9_SPIOL|nr:uncharacterized protein LOC110798749 [Spinacia oleracea]KNA13952.1 hypothetical protein SOVF_111940 [Spinacia oleracea]
MKTNPRSSKRKEKRSQKHSKKKSRSSREKPRKLKQRDHSVSCFDEDSISIKLVSCSSPGDDSRSKKRGRSRDRRHKRDKKRSKRSSGDDSPHVKESKKSKKSRGSDSRKKRHVKRRKRDRSVSSSSSRSRSFPLREPGDDSDREFERKEEKVESKERKGREKDREKSGSKRSRHSSRSLSPCSVHSGNSSHYSEERVLEKSNPKRLKSVIVVMKEKKVPEEQELNRVDGHENEIVFDYDDYPSKSNDSIDGVSGREALSYSHDVSSEKRTLGEPNKEPVASDIRTSDFRGIQRHFVEGSGGLSSSYVRSKVDVPSIENRSAVFTANAGPNHEDLEAILRQKALENLLKRQVNLSTKVTAGKKGDHDTEVNRSSIVKAQPVDQSMPHVEGNNKAVQNVGKVVNDVTYTSNTTNLRGPLEDTGPSKDNNDVHLLSAKVETAHPEEKCKTPGNFINSRSNVGLSMSRKEILGAKNTWKRQLTPRESSQKNLSAPKEMIVKDSNEKMMSQEKFQRKLCVPQETNSKDSTRDAASPQIGRKGSTVKVDTVAVSEASSSAPASGHESRNDNTNETDEDTQFEKKSMSVMRGGEMVQVSYKVYIPKKIPALARRQLKR